MKSADPNQSPGSGETRGGSGDNPAERVRQAGREAVSDATQEVRGKLERGVSSAADSAASTSEVLDQAAAEFSAHGQETLAKATSVLAGKLSDLAGQLEQRSIEDLFQDARRLAQRNPALFVAGGVALGLALSRFFKASTPSAGYAAGSSQFGGGPAYGGEGAVPSQGSGYGQSSGSPYAGSPQRAGDTPSADSGHGPARAPSTAGNPLGVGGQHE